MMAFKCFTEKPQEGCVLVYAETRTSAKHISSGGLYDWEHEKITVSRIPSLDDFYEGRAIIHANSELPRDAPDFFVNPAWDGFSLNKQQTTERV